MKLDSVAFDFEELYFAIKIKFTTFFLLFSARSNTTTCGRSPLCAKERSLRFLLTVSAVRCFPLQAGKSNKVRSRCKMNGVYDATSYILI